MLTIYTPFEEGPLFGGRLFVHTGGNPYSLVTPVTQIIRGMSVDQPVEHAATLEDVRAEVLTPDRLNSLVFGVFAAVALAIAVVGVAGVLAFSAARAHGIRHHALDRSRSICSGAIAEGNHRGRRAWSQAQHLVRLTRGGKDFLTQMLGHASTMSGFC
jgi:hypothetical protein